MDNLRGALLMVLAMAGFAIEDAFVKAITARVPMGQVLVYLGAGGGLAIAMLATRAGYCWRSRAFFTPVVMLRNAGEIVGTTAFVTALTLIPLSLASALLQAMPLFVTLGAIVFMRVQVGWRRWAALAVGLIGVLIILRPGFEGFRPEALFGLLAALGLATRDLATRACPREVHPLQLSAWGFFMLVPIGAGLLALSGGAVRPSPVEGGMILGALALGMVGYYALTRAMQTGEIAFVTPFRYTRLVFGLAIGWMLFGEPLDAPMLVGAAIVVGAGLYTLIRERRLMRRPTAVPPPTAI